MRAWIATIITGSCIAAAVQAQPSQLADAPRRFESQDISSWSYDVVPKAAKTRNQVAALYQSVYVAGDLVSLNWTGAIATCDAGATNADHQQAVVDRVNYFRALADLPPVQLVSGLQMSAEQQAALMMSANNALSHTPPSTWLCYSELGANGAMSSNIALGIRGVDAIDAYMDDYGTNNPAVGHRRWVLFPPRASMTTGDISEGSQRPANALFVFGTQAPRPATPNGIAWPPAGVVPYQNLPFFSNRWSFSYPGADFTNASVTMSGPAGPIPVAYEAVLNGYGDNTIVFLPSGFSYAKPNADTTYTITVSGIVGSGVPSAIQYPVTVIDPDVAVPDPLTVDVVEFYNASLDHYFITWVPAEIANLDAGRTPTKWNRTGYTFKAYTSAQSGTSPVCRFYIPPGKGDSHFFGRGTAECNATAQQHPDFVVEEANFMFLFLPAAGQCPSGTTPIFRVFSNRPDANHRYMTDPAVRSQMVSLGWLAEGDGPNLVVMCAPAN
ncbi:MAG TPA: CAP domain-containing protein [Casimicrobiaceae bacterium]|jgi:uncharacterized protein YkwD